MSTEALHHAHDDHGHHDAGATKVFGFWIYIMTDCIIFATLFATYAVLHNNIATGPSGKEIFELPFVLVETFLLLISSFTSGISMLAMHQGDKAKVIKWLIITALLGAGFVAMEIYEFHHLIEEGIGPDKSAFLSSFFTLVGTHGFHVSCGLIWMVVMMFLVSKQGLTDTNKTRLTCLSLFWHFLDIVWICVFTVVYLMGAM
ncbi:cytochrome o ubiquinol oxidase subunit III [Pokkaliibacter sp. MBI-7]|uniref:cytochrome o ubiquinol oxidase subunit III n=1 Tax=Pokkaliibacter sp. MBI-7 TaxID=3040600 RepID=UPI002446BBB9|nr:cytochrome o ubiquinol oxidase subunit III [Pokkaliibacter sp. MBI-7]MDH2436377.1 cytochrome o ubiquinol oxidase subunit III [Pokkaliibacter sp. MBI-7]